MTLEQLLSARIIAIVRGIEEKNLIPAAEALFRGGIRAIEVTYNTPGAGRMIEQLKAQFGQRMHIGAGTVLDAATARDAIAAGADFLLSPAFDQGMVETCHRYGKIAVPGVMTPTEIVRAYEKGCTIVKIFPACVLGPGFIKQIHGPLSHVKMMAVGGITCENLPEYLAAGACCAGVGSQLADNAMIAQGKFDLLEQNAVRFISRLSRKM